MDITETFYAASRREWRGWLKKNHKKKKEIWLVYYSKGSGKDRVSYNDAVEEALCFGWIDSTAKKVDHHSSAQRFSPRNPKSAWSELNKERARQLIKAKKMTKAGLALIPDLDISKFIIPADLLKMIRSDKETWNNFQKFPESYQRIRVGFLDASRNRPEFFKKRTDYFLRMTKQNKMYGTMR